MGANAAATKPGIGGNIAENPALAVVYASVTFNRPKSDKS